MDTIVIKPSKTILVNCSNLKFGGGIQVAQSICCELQHFRDHRFILVLSDKINDEGFCETENTKIYRYEIKNNLRTLIFGRDTFLDGLVEREKVDAVLTVFGPSRWLPRVPHLCGFARSQLLLKDSPYYQMSTLKEKIVYRIWTWGFRRSSDTFYTETPYISGLLPQLIKGAKVYTVSNYYHQVFDEPEKWQRKVCLDPFQGTTLLTISSTAPHKNLGIMVPVADCLERKCPDFDFRFVLTCQEPPFPIPERLRRHFVFVGTVDISECPHLYEQADVMFMPTLMECFTATYPEAMRMEVPIVTTDLEFARDLCGEAACYYSAVDAQAAACAIFRVAKDKAYAQQLIIAGKEQLKQFDNYHQRAEKLIKILENLKDRE